jgi:hypothetical protein
MTIHGKEFYGLRCIWLQGYDEAMQGQQIEISDNGG